MTQFFEIRNKLKKNLYDHSNLANEIHTNDDVIQETLKNLNQGELSIAVVGEVNRGKSTFLNILGLLDSYDSGEFYFNDIDSALFL